LSRACCAGVRWYCSPSVDPQTFGIDQVEPVGLVDGALKLAVVDARELDQRQHRCDHRYAVESI